MSNCTFQNHLSRDTNLAQLHPSPESQPLRRWIPINRQTRRGLRSPAANHAGRVSNERWHQVVLEANTCSDILRPRNRWLLDFLQSQ